MSRLESILRILVFLNGLILLCAAGAVFLPVATMAHYHELLGLEELPTEPIVIYLARSTSLLYAVHGAVTLYVACYWQQHHAMVRFLAGLHVVIGLCMIGIDLSASMPWYWTAFEGAPIAMFGVLLLVLYHKSFGSKAEASTASTDQAENAGE